MSWPKATDYHEAIQSLRFTLGDEELRAGELALNRRGLPLLWSGNFADVYKVHCPASGNTWAVKCFTREVPGLHDRYREISAHLEQARLPFMVEFRYLDEGIRCAGQWYPILKMRWVEGTGLNQFVAQYLHQPGTLRQLQQLWVKLAGRLREARLAHGDLQHGNVLLVPVPGSEQLGLRLIDYDGMYVPSLAGRRSGEVGHPAYQHPQRAREGIYSGEVDRFSHLVIYTAVQCLLAHPQELWARFDNGDNLLFRDADFQRPGESALLRALWEMGDEQVRALTGRLALACRQPLQEAPWLDQVLDNGHVLALTPAEQRAADTLLAEQRAAVVPTAIAPPIAGSMPPPVSAPAPSAVVRPAWLDTSPAKPERAPGTGTTPIPIAVPPLIVTEARRRVAARSRFGRMLVWGLIVAMTAALAGTIVYRNARLREALAEIAAAERSRHAAVATQEADRKKAEEEADRKRAEEVAAQQDAERRRPKKKAARKAAKQSAQEEADADAGRNLPFWKSIDLGHGAKLELVLIPAGSFIMGDDKGNPHEKPAHKVTITRPFYLGKYEVTQEQWIAVMGSNPSKQQDPENLPLNRPGQVGRPSQPELPTGPGTGSKYPVEQVSWNDCQAFLDKLNAMTRGQGGRFTLPTEAQWEYACRAGSSAPYCFGEAESECDDYAWHVRNSDNRTHAVGEKRPNAWKLHDVHGNVWEWCADWYDPTYYASAAPVDPQGPAEGSSRVARGGSRYTLARTCRSSSRYNKKPEVRSSDLGLRVAWVLPEEGAAAPSPPRPMPQTVEVGQTLNANNTVTQPRSSTPAKKEIAVNLGRGVNLELVLIPAGTFLMGDNRSRDDEKPVHRVNITRPFYLGKYEVTQEQWQVLMGENNASYFKGRRAPMERISWHDCQAFLERLNATARMPGARFTLPTEAQWEYACRAGSTLRYCFGDDESGLDKYAWYEKNSGKKTHTVGTRSPNAWGLYDMHGNVYEWCQDRHSSKYYLGSPLNDPQGPSSGSHRVFRGGSWFPDVGLCRSAYRDALPPDTRHPAVGFRVAQTLTE